MNKYLIFLIISFLFLIHNLDKKIMIDYLKNSSKYINIYHKNKKCLFIKLLVFRIIFIILFLIYPILALIKSFKNQSIKRLFFYLKHPISIFDPNLKSYNLYFQKKEMFEAQDENYWKILFYYYNYNFSEEISPESEVLKVIVSDNNVLTMRLKHYDIKDNFIENTLTGEVKNNILPKKILESIEKESISIYKKVKDKFKIIELTVMIQNNEFHFVSGNSNPKLILSKDFNYIIKSNLMINYLHNPKQ
jgi:hypothetical protein